VAEKLADILGGMNYGVACSVKICEQITFWAEIVDDKVRKNSEAVKIRDKVLTVITSSPTWAQELTFLKVELVKKFNELAGEEVIIDIRFSPKLVS